MKMTKKAGLFYAFLWILVIFGVLLATLGWFVSPSLTLIAGILTVVLALVALIYHHHLRSLMLATYEMAAQNLSTDKKEALEKFPFPVLVCDREHHVLFNNQKFVLDVMGGQNLTDLELESVLRDIRPDFKDSVEHFPVTIGAKEYTTFVSSFSLNGQPHYTYYFVEDTQQKELIRTYYATRPVVMLLYIDNLEETFAGRKESEKVALLGQIETLLEEFIGETSGFLTKLDKDRFMAVLEEQHAEKIVEARFCLLDKVRQLTPAGETPVTLSVGVGRGCSDLLEAEKYARQALDMALGRGGDQAAVHTPDGYSFFGGVSKGVEKRSKIKTRIMASAISELIEHADSVFVMGHHHSDLDSLASAAVMSKVAEAMGKEAFVVLRRNESLAAPLLELLESSGRNYRFLDPEEAIKRIAPNSLLIVTDNHSTTTVESLPLLESCANVAVIDHHRKTVNFIEKTVLFYHEPFASSASEMVAELCQYIGQGEFVSRTEAEALLSGIMLDTHSFSIQAGVRTFEAAAWLRSKGADASSVKRLFRGSAEDYRIRTGIVSSAAFSGGIAVAVNSETTPAAQMLSGQAADEMLSFDGVRATFVFYRSGDRLALSARSYGDVNVQLVMEDLGGGGHRTMAATRFAPEVSLEEAKKMLCDVLSQRLGDGEIDFARLI